MFGARTRPRALAFLAVLAAAALGRADQALVIGIGKYKHPGPEELFGPPSDAKTMAEFCRERHYDLPPERLLIGAQATKAAILAAFKSLEASLKPNEKALVYFACHGMKRGPAAKPLCFIMPYDYSNARRDSAIGVDELYAAMRRLPTKANRTVILDCCYAGGMGRAYEGAPVVRARGYTPPEDAFPEDAVPHLVPRSGSVAFPDAGQAASAPDPENKEICYLTAAKANEQALEVEIGGKSQGLFTKFLIPELKKSETGEQTTAAVRKSIAGYLDKIGSVRKQNPEVTKEFRELIALKEAPEGTGPPRPPEPPKVLWDLLGRDRPNADRLTLTATPNLPSALVGESIEFRVQVKKKAGYLVVVWNGKGMQLISPGMMPNGSFVAVEVPPGDYTITRQGEGGKAFAQAGDNRVTALLFESPGPAKALIDALTASKPPTVEQMASLGLVDTGGGSQEYATAGLTFEVGDELLGGYRVADAPALFDALWKGTGKDNLKLYASPQLLEIVTDPKNRGTREYSECLTACLNSTLMALARRGEPFWDGSDEELSEEERAKVRPIAKELPGKTMDEARVLSARMIAAVYPTLLVKAHP